MGAPAKYPRGGVRPDPIEQLADSIRSDALRSCFAPDKLDSRPSKPQTAVLKGIQDHLIRYVVSGNQGGKTAMAIRELTWLLNRCHPWFSIPKEWGAGPYTFIVSGQDRTQMENMWQQRILPFLVKAEWREIRSGSALQMVQSRTNGDQIIFISHANSSENDIKHMQYYSAHWVWVDEMPKSIRVLEELQRRIDAYRGRFICTFTMKYRNDKIRKLVDASDGVVAKKYHLGKFDNPIYAGREAEERAKIAALPLAMQEAILFGKWITGDLMVYEWDPDVMSGKPEGYHFSWRHALVVDPATASKLGATVWAEDPRTEVWWCIRADYVSGIHAPSDIVDAVEKKVEGLNVVLRVYDSEASWYAGEARKKGFVYRAVPRKNVPGAKENMIAKFKGALGTDIRIAEWCSDLINEITECERNEADESKIVNKSRFHLIDSSHYFVLMKPGRERTATVYSSVDHQLLEQDNKRRLAEKKAELAAAMRIIRRNRAGRWTVRRR